MFNVESFPVTASPSNPLCGKQSGLGGVLVSIRQENAYVEFFPAEEGKGDVEPDIYPLCRGIIHLRVL
ncbi:hypothetical protein GCM10011328_33690 [Hafnia psychrotolerans]|uniref:Uncharacterized protein n=1 Tax=Hafnia psychrotolerans TaxID=1477018 RepID=A0ABQ1H2L0_9GAMM|nr:hypothetical protein GCM10011328_33690 [Hafnia psychrotolerans]